LSVLVVVLWVTGLNRIHRTISKVRIAINDPRRTCRMAEEGLGYHSDDSVILFSSVTHDEHNWS
jgi:hypothetical protein